MTIHEANMRLLFRLYELYDNREAENIADLVMEKITGWTRIDRVVNKEVKCSAAMEEELDQYIDELAAHKPVQYVLHEAWFAGMKMYVDENVLIPRPETEELVNLVIKEIKGDKTHRTINKTILDIGTGSGCIAIAIKKNLPECNVYAIDVSEAAIDVASKNAKHNNVEISLKKINILDESQWSLLPSFDIIISNPPYIPLQEKNKMQHNVTQYEPQVALFVPDNDPILFYKAIARFAEKKLLAGGKVFVEIHEDYGEQVRDVFGGNSEIIKDMQGKERFLKTNKKK